MNANVQMLNRIEICNGTEVPETALCDFYDRMFPQKSHLLNQYWRWLYRLDQFPEAKPPLLAVLDGAVIGQISQIPVTLNLGGREQLAVWGSDYGILPEYRGSGIGYHMSRMWMERYPIYLAVCTPASFRIVQKQGWTPRRMTYDLRLPLRPERHPKFQRGTSGAAMKVAGPGWYLMCRALRAIRTSEDAMLRCRPLMPEDLSGWSLPQHHHQTEKLVYVSRNHDFMKWRLLEGPFARQYRLMQVDGSPVVAIIRTFNYGTMRRLRVIALSGRIVRRAALERFFGGLLRWAFQNRIDLVRMVTGDPLVLEAGRRWFPFRRQLRFAFYCTGAEDDAFMDAAEHRWELLDSDFDLLT